MLETTERAPAEVESAGLVADEVIVGRVLEGDLAAFELIMRRYNQRIFRIVRSMIADDSECEDILQETYLSAFQHLRQFAGQAKFSTWLTRIAVHAAIARRQRLARSTSIDFSDPANVAVVPFTRRAGAEREASLKELGMALNGVIDSLPEELRTVFALRVVEGLDTAETASCLELSEANVKVRLHRARALLRTRLDAELGADVRELYQFGNERCDRIVNAVLARLSQNEPPAS
jgi:RNA polymerase sigma-70 factor (ECF subfamily)